MKGHQVVQLSDEAHANLQRLREQHGEPGSVIVERLIRSEIKRHADERAIIEALVAAEVARLARSPLEVVADDEATPDLRGQG